MLQTEANPALRRAAAQGLAGLMQNVTAIARNAWPAFSVPRVHSPEARMFSSSSFRPAFPAVTAAGPAATDTDPEVRRLGLEVFQLAAMALADMVGEATAAVEELPPAGRPLERGGARPSQDLRRRR